MAYLIPKNFALHFYIFRMWTVSTVKKLYKVFKSKPVERGAFSEAAFFKISVFFVAILLTKSDFNVVEDVALHRFEGIDKGIDGYGADIIAVP